MSINTNKLPDAWKRYFSGNMQALRDLEKIFEEDKDALEGYLGDPDPTVLVAKLIAEVVKRGREDSTFPRIVKKASDAAMKRVRMAGTDEYFWEMIRLINAMLAMLSGGVPGKGTIWSSASVMGANHIRGQHD
jgi:hypothetical protein